MPSMSRRDAMAAWDPSRDVVVVVGGQDANSGALAGDLLEWNGRTWRRLQPAPAPDPERYVAMTAAPMGGVLTYSSGSVSGLWHWDGTRWTPVPASSLGARWGTALANHPRGTQVVLFGGFDPVVGSDLADTWSWNGVTWNAVPSPTAPAPRSLHAMALDRARGEIVLAGGIRDAHGQGAPQPFRDTWSLQGNRWVALAGQGAFPRAALVFDERRGRLALLQDPTIVSEWLGSAWVPRAPARPPTAPAACGGPVFHGAAWHRGTGRILAVVECATPPVTSAAWNLGAVQVATVAEFGPSCPDPIATRLVADSGQANLPWLGSEVRLAVALATGTNAAGLLFALGSSDTAWNGQPLPMSLLGLGLPNCSLLVAPEVMHLELAPERTWSLFVPMQPTLLGVSFFTQVAVLAPLTAAGFSVTNGLRLQVGGP